MGHCSCKAGNSERCRHMIAMLLHVNRTGIQNLDLLTSTDVTQAWGKLKTNALYEACKLKELCHVQCKPLPILGTKQQEIRQRLIATAHQSALALHQRARMHYIESNQVCECATIQEQILIKHIMKNEMEQYSELMFHDMAFSDATAMRIYKFSKNDLAKNELQFYITHIKLTEEEALLMCTETRHQDNTKWRRARKVRITGSICHAYFTYIPKDPTSCESKGSKMLSESFWGNNATRYGKHCKQLAIEKYSSITINDVSKIGFVVHPKDPWLGYSPDGVVFKNSNPAILLEVKSPVLGKTSTAAQLAMQKKLAYIKKNGENFTVNPRHPYFLQVQLGMFLLNLAVTHFVVYSELELI
nr:uncharacterized protein LOC119176395 [Rhipicephalus microplus]XP_037283552.1 uncharacterized protein LOC119176395 [Rhipicephalus microplus]